MNNRQSGRRRGRNNNSNNNNNRSQSGGGRGGVDQANRIDSRARGNGAQMIEKYRNLARDAQLAGDRVQTEYYLQFADHYFRVVSDFRARQEEKAAANGQERSHDRSREIRGVEDFDGHDDTDTDFEADTGRDDGDNGEDRSERNDRGNDRGDRNDRGQRGNREARGDRDDDNRGNREARGNRDDDNRGTRQSARSRPARNRDEDEAQGDRSQAPAREEAAEQEPAPRPARRTVRRPRQDDSADDGNAGIDTAVLPPAIGRPERSAESEAEGDAPAAKPRRTRRTLATRNTDVEAAE